MKTNEATTALALELSRRLNELGVDAGESYSGVWIGGVALVQLADLLAWVEAQQ